ncbi:MAG: ABC transporter permease [Chitinophagaceae bacterium]
MFRTNFRIAWRNLVKHRNYTLINTLGLALSICCGIVIFVLVRFHLSFDDFHADANRIYRVVTEQHRDNISYSSSVPSPFGKVFRNDYSFAEKTARVAQLSNELVNISINGENRKFKEPTGIAFAEPEYFDIFNFPLVKGSRSNLLSSPHEAIISERMARKYFGDKDPINQTITVANRVEAKVTGVLKDLPANTDLPAEIIISYASLKDYNTWMASDDSWGGMTSAMRCYIKLKNDVTPEQVEAVLPAYVTKFRAGNKNIHHYKLQPLSALHFDGRYGGIIEKRNLWILSFIGLFLVITACVNFVNLATAQAVNRSREVGIRKVIGGKRSQLFWQFIGETAIITILATLTGLLLANIALPYLNRWLGTAVSVNLFRSWQLSVFLIAQIIVVTFMAGAYPGLILSGFKPIAAIKGRISRHQLGGLNTRRTLIVGQFAISFILIIGMIVIAKQVQFAKQSSMGFDKDAIVVVPAGEGPTSTAQTLKTKLSQLPGVEKISQCYEPPSSDAAWNAPVRFGSRAEDEPFAASVKSADNQYLSTFSLQLVAGRNVFPSDTARELLINETMVKKLGLKSPEEAIGKNISISLRTPLPVVGVMRDFNDHSFHEDISAVAIWTDAGFYVNYALKVSKANVAQTLSAIEKTWSETYPDQVYEYKFLDDKIAGFYKNEAFMLQGISIFCLIAIFIGCLGLYGLVSFMVVQKTREIGIRKVLGSSPIQLVWLFGREFSRLILLAFVVAAPVAWWMMTNWLKDFEYRINFSGWIFLLALGSIAIIASITVGYRTVRAALSSPVKNLRAD